MARVALVTGGTRGIGAAISQALQAAGYSVAATYAGNTKAAEAFAAKTGIRVHQWDIGDFEGMRLRRKGRRGVARPRGRPDQQCRHRT
jgi:NAD(P)-dependent dehydrogenase (short-subunit alcohol dehydrogenase family)